MASVTGDTPLPSRTGQELMMKPMAITACALSLILGSAAFAQDAADTNADEQTTAAGEETSEAVNADAETEGAEDPGDRMRCKQVRVVNSRIPTRVCLTVDEWEARNRETLEEKRRMRNRNSYCPASGPC